MNKTSTRSVLALLSALSLGTGPLRAQATPSRGTDSTELQEKTDSGGRSLSDAPSGEEEIFTMDPFTVQSEHDGYKADDTLAGGRVRTRLKDTPASLSVVTAKLMHDLGITRAEELFVYTPNTEVAGLNGNFSGLSARGQGIPSGGAEGTRLTNPAGVNRSRGLTAMDSTRNYFPSDIPWDGFNISRVDISRGPNSFLFGTGSPSGISTTRCSSIKSWRSASIWSTTTANTSRSRPSTTPRGPMERCASTPSSWPPTRRTRKSRPASNMAK
jgi:outer membrane receptor protein involved in Fe transport